MISPREQRLLRIIDALEQRRTQEEINAALDRLEVEIKRAKDASGHEHEGKGSPTGGQFTSGGDGGGIGAEKPGETHGRKPRPANKPGQIVKPAEATPSGKPAKPKAVRGEMVEARREGTGKDARIVMADGKPAPEHIKPSMVPPEWTDVKITTDPNSDVLVTARDKKGRPKTVYAKSLEVRNAMIKFSKIKEMLGMHAKIADEIQKARQDAATKEEADCAWLMQVQATRPGSDRDTKANVKAYGATTLEARHVVETKEGVRLQFIGKEGIWHDHLIRDKELGKMLLDRKNAAKSANDRLFNTTYDDVHRFTVQRDGGKFTPKDFRTSAATSLAVETVQANPQSAKDEKEYKTRVKEVAVKVSSLLGNKPAQALKSYIAPFVFAPWSPK